MNDGPPAFGDSAAAVVDSVAGVGVAVVDADRTVAWVNDAFESFFGVAASDVVGVDARAVARDHLAPATADPERFTATAAADGDAGVDQFTCHVTPGDGRAERWLDYATRPIDRGRYAGGRVDLYDDVTDRVECDSELERRRAELARLEHVTAMVRTVNRALADAESRADIESTVVSRLAGVEPFAFATFAAFGRRVDEFTSRAWAGLDADAADAVLAATPTRALSDAVRTLTVQVESLDDAGGVGGVACVPVAYHGQVYGVVAVYADCVGAFDDREVAVLTELGDSVAHAINAIARRDALLGEQVVEVGLRSAVAAEPFAVLGDATATVVVERTIPLPDGRFLQYVTVDGLDADEFAAVVGHIPRYDRVRHVGDSDGSRLFELTATEPPVAGPVADHGGRVRRIVVEGGDLLVKAELPQSADVRSVLDALRPELPDVTLVYHRTAPRRRTRPRDLDAALADLTDRQRTAFEAAYFGGYFDWPRASTAEELASSLGISSPTFHQHLRRALDKLLSAFVDE